ncbi:MAG: Xaa-Pro peptidase family protein [Desulfonatronovibrio sp.]
MEDRYIKRIQKLREKMSSRGIKFFLVQSPASRFYLSGFELFDPQGNESSGYLLVTDRKVMLMTDPRYLEAGKESFPPEDILIYFKDKYQKINEFLKKLGVDRLGIEPQWMNYEFFESLKKEFELEPVKGMVEDLRLIKDPDEIRLMKESCALNHKVFKLIEDMVGPGLTEVQIAWEAEKMFRENQASGLSFSTIVASGPKSAQPHAIPANIPVKENAPLLIDMGCRLNDYCSDQTRTFWVGKDISDTFLKTRDLVMQAQQKVIDKIEPGMPVSQAYDLVRSFFQDKGVFEHFTHALGHGIGLETHEPPSISPAAKVSFQPGMIVSIEPGLYYPDWGGVRWEYMILINENGVEVL